MGKVKEKETRYGPQSREQFYVGVLDRLSTEAPEASHRKADQALLDFLEEKGFNDLAEAWERTRDRCGFWYS